MSIDDTIRDLANSITPEEKDRAQQASKIVATMYGDGGDGVVVNVVRPLVMQKHRQPAEQF